MWAGNPLLFPLVSHNRVGAKANAFGWAGKEFSMPQHGFARRVPWRIVGQNSESVTMEITDTPATRQNYPFQFRHQFTYWLEAGRLHWRQIVENTGTEPMPFGTGVHPYFAVPLTARGCRQDCFVEIPSCRRLTAVGEFDRFDSQPFPAEHWSVAHDVAGTMFLSDLSRRELALVDPTSKLRVVLNWEAAPQHRFAALWSRTTNAPYYCLEPWTALPNSFHRPDGELVVLRPGQMFEAAMWMELQPAG
jgi:galactose mutarotase-like enzyme